MFNPNATSAGCTQILGGLFGGGGMQGPGMGGQAAFGQTALGQPISVSVDAGAGLLGGNGLGGLFGMPAMPQQGQVRSPPTCVGRTNTVSHELCQAGLHGLGRLSGIPAMPQQAQLRCWPCQRWAHRQL